MIAKRIPQLDGDTSELPPRWRDLAAVLLPEEFSAASMNRTERCSTYQFFAELGPAARDAHAAEDRDKLSRIHAFAEWSQRHPSKQLWNAAAVSFYEHIFDHGADIDSVMAWIPPRTRREVSGLWEFMLQPARLALVRQAAESVWWNHQRECDEALNAALASLRKRSGRREA